MAVSRQWAATESRWLGLLAAFDRREGWPADGQLSGVDWPVRAELGQPPVALVTATGGH